MFMSLSVICIAFAIWGVDSFCINIGKNPLPVNQERQIKIGINFNGFSLKDVKGKAITPRQDFGNLKSKDFFCGLSRELSSLLKTEPAGATMKNKLKEKIGHDYPEIEVKWSKLIDEWEIHGINLKKVDEKIKEHFGCEPMKSEWLETTEKNAKRIKILAGTITALWVIMLAIMCANIFEAIRSPIEQCFYRCSVVTFVVVCIVVFLVIGVGSSIGVTLVNNKMWPLFWDLSEAVAEGLDQNVNVELGYLIDTTFDTNNSELKKDIKKSCREIINGLGKTIIGSFDVHINITHAWGSMIFIAVGFLICYVISFCCTRMRITSQQTKEEEQTSL